MKKVTPEGVKISTFGSGSRISRSSLRVVMGFQDKFIHVICLHARLLLFTAFLFIFYF